jgi:hypothetical protein
VSQVQDCSFLVQKEKKREREKAQVFQETFKAAAPNLALTSDGPLLKYLNSFSAFCEKPN